MSRYKECSDQIMLLHEAEEFCGILSSQSKVHTCHTTSIRILYLPIHENILFPSPSKQIILLHNGNRFYTLICTVTTSWKRQAPINIHTVHLQSELARKLNGSLYPLSHICSTASRCNASQGLHENRRSKKTTVNYHE